MKILVTGSCGYIGSRLGRHLKDKLEGLSSLHGLDSGLFLGSCVVNNRPPDSFYDNIHFIDLRDVSVESLTDFDAVIALAAVSNDPIGNDFSDATHDINSLGTLALARKCLDAGVQKFIFASSCSIYGAGGTDIKSEQDSLKPLTAYARSKVFVENELKDSYFSSMDINCLRFATACGYSDRLRLDLVLNDFVNSAITNKCITVLSDGTPWRPLIDVEEMCNAILWSLLFKTEDILGTNYLAINIGSNDWNYTVADLANLVASNLGIANVSINSDASPDNRSYRVSFDLYQKLAPNFYPRKSINTTISELSSCLKSVQGSLPLATIRLKQLRYLQASGLLNTNLRWTI